MESLGSGGTHSRGVGLSSSRGPTVVSTLTGTTGVRHRRRAHGGGGPLRVSVQHSGRGFGARCCGGVCIHRVRPAVHRAVHAMGPRMASSLVRVFSGGPRARRARAVRTRSGESRGGRLVSRSVGASTPPRGTWRTCVSTDSRAFAQGRHYPGPDGSPGSSANGACRPERARLPALAGLWGRVRSVRRAWADRGSGGLDACELGLWSRARRISPAALSVLECALRSRGTRPCCARGPLPRVFEDS